MQSDEMKQWTRYFKRRNQKSEKDQADQSLVILKEAHKKQISDKISELERELAQLRIIMKAMS